MQRLLSFAAALVLAAGLSGAAAAQKIDAQGKCHDASGKYAKMEVCKGAPSAMGAATTASTTGKCRDKTTHKFAKCGAPNTEPVPAKSAASAAKPAAATAAAPAPAATTAASAGRCRDKTTHKFAKCGAPNTEPVPAKK